MTSAELVRMGSDERYRVCAGILEPFLKSGYINIRESEGLVGGYEVFLDSNFYDEAMAEKINENALTSVLECYMTKGMVFEDRKCSEYIIISNRTMEIMARSDSCKIITLTDSEAASLEIKRHENVSLYKFKLMELVCDGKNIHAVVKNVGRNKIKMAKAYIQTRGKMGGVIEEYNAYLIPSEIRPGEIGQLHGYVENENYYECSIIDIYDEDGNTAELLKVN